MSTAPCPDPDDNNQSLFEAVDKVFETSDFSDEDGNLRSVEFLNPDVVELEVQRFRRFLESTPSGVSPHDEG